MIDPTTPPAALRIDGVPAPAVTDSAAPRFGWLDPRGCSEARVEVRAEGGVIWDSGFVQLDQPGLVYGGPPPSPRTKYTWRVRTRSPEGVSAWSEPAGWHTGLLFENSWSGRWIGRAVPPATRPIQLLAGDHVERVRGSDWIGQEFTTHGPIDGVAVCLTAAPLSGVACTLQVVAPQTFEVLAEVRLTHFIGHYFSHWVSFDTPPPPGTYIVRVTDVQGEVGWLTSSSAPVPRSDDGVSAVMPVGAALRNGAAVAGMRSIAVEVPAAPNPHLFKDFEITGPIRTARLYAVGLGYGDFRVNGRPVWDGVLEPAPLMYDKRIHYRCHDVAPLLRQGANRVDAFLGRGFFAVRGMNAWGWQAAPWHQEPCMRLQLEIETADGRETIVASDQSWQTLASPVVADRLLNGETRRAGGPSEAAVPAIEVPKPAGRLELAMLPPIRRHGPLAVAAATTPDAHSTVYDFGEVTAGWVRARFDGAAGSSFSISYGEELDAQGNVKCQNIHAAGPAQIDRCVLVEAQAGAVWEPSVTYKGFRYAQIRTEGDVRVSDVQAIPVHTDVAPAGSFACADDTLNWIDDSLRRTFLNNLHGIPTDTPVFEKNGWTADAHLATEALLHHFDLHAFFRKWLRDHADAQDKDGVVPQIVPTPGWGRGLDPSWSASYPLILWNAYCEYGDRSLLEEHIGNVLRYVEVVHRTIEQDGWIWRGYSWSDWLSPGYAWPPEGPSPTATLMTLRLTDRAALICDVLGMRARAATLRETIARIAAIYHDTYFDASSGTYVSKEAGYRQSMNVLPLAFGVVPRQEVPRVAAGLARDLRERTGEHLDVGAIAVKHLLPVLSAHGHHDLALTVALQPTRPGWRPWMLDGSKTLYESWGEKVRSHDHYFLGSVAQWIHEDVAGLRPTSPGCKTFDVAPRLGDPRVPWARIDHQTVRGRVAVDWRTEANATALSVSVPPGAVARVDMGGSYETLGAGTHHLKVPHPPAR